MLSDGNDTNDYNTGTPSFFSNLFVILCWVSSHLRMIVTTQSFTVAVYLLVVVLIAGCYMYDIYIYIYIYSMDM